jgi:hypothetical protein
MLLLVDACQFLRLVAQLYNLFLWTRFSSVKAVPDLLALGLLILPLAPLLLVSVYELYFHFNLIP